MLYAKEELYTTDIAVPVCLKIDGEDRYIARGVNIIELAFMNSFAE